MFVFVFVFVRRFMKRMCEIDGSARGRLEEAGWMYNASELEFQSNLGKGGK